jgi:predicted metal-binding membrane protein
MSSGHTPVVVSGPSDRATTVTRGALLAITAAAWVHVVSATGAHGNMAMEESPVTLAAGAAYVVGWAVMMAAMMLPSALPMIALYAVTQRGAGATGPRGVPVALFTLVYLGLWAATGVPVYAASALLKSVESDLLPYGLALLLLAAGIYQMSPLKQVCLRACRSPLGFLLGRWRPGLVGSLALGWSHAVYCVGCCWALMVVLVAAGAMGLSWVLLIAVLVTAEKLLPHGEWIARGAGVALMLLGLAVALRPDLTMLLRHGHLM